MDVLVWDFFQFGTPLLDVMPFRVVLLAKLQHIEQVGVVTVNARFKVPTRIIELAVVVQQLLLVEERTEPPVLHEIESEVARSDLSGSKTYVALDLHLTHDGVDDWHACCSCSPSVYYVFESFPFELWLFQQTISSKDFDAVSETIIVEVVPAQQMIDEKLCLFYLATILFFELVNFPVNIPDRDTPTSKPG